MYPKKLSLKSCLQQTLLKKSQTCLCLRPLLIWSGANIWQPFANSYCCWIQYEQKQEFIHLRKEVEFDSYLMLTQKRNTTMLPQTSTVKSPRILVGRQCPRFFLPTKPPSTDFLFEGPDILNAPGSTNCWCGSDVEGIGEVRGGRGGESSVDNNQIQPVDFWGRNFWGYHQVVEQKFLGKEFLGKEFLGLNKKLEISSDDGEELGGGGAIVGNYSKNLFFVFGRTVSGDRKSLMHLVQWNQESMKLDPLGDDPTRLVEHELLASLWCLPVDRQPKIWMMNIKSVER